MEKYKCPGCGKIYEKYMAYCPECNTYWIKDKNSYIIPIKKQANRGKRSAKYK